MNINETNQILNTQSKCEKCGRFFNATSTGFWQCYQHPGYIEQAKNEYGRIINRMSCCKIETGQHTSFASFYESKPADGIQTGCVQADHRSTLVRFTDEINDGKLETTIRKQRVMNIPDTHVKNIKLDSSSAPTICHVYRFDWKV
jgi:hypothetical protein